MLVKEKDIYFFSILDINIRYNKKTKMFLCFFKKHKHIFNIKFKNINIKNKSLFLYNFIRLFLILECYGLIELSNINNVSV